jgi:hypothetical protein
VFYGIVKNGATDAGDHLKKVFDASGKASESTMSSLGKLLEQLGIQTKEQLRTTAAEAESQLLTIVSIYGLRSKEAAQAWETLKNDIMASHDELPPHLQRIYDHMEGITNRATENMTGSHRRSADDSARAHEEASRRIAAAYEFATRESVARVRELQDEHRQFLAATDQLLENSGFRWGSTLEELRAQIQQTREEYNAWSRAVGVDSQLVELNMQRLNTIINELQSRMRDLSDAEREARGSTDDLAEAASGLSTVFGTLIINTTLFGREVELVQNRFGEWRPRIEEVTDGLRETTERSNALSGSLSGVGSAIRDTAGALGALTTAQQALNEAWEGSPLYAGSQGSGIALRRGTSRTGGGSGNGAGGSSGSSGGLTDPGGIDNRESLVIGQGPGQLPVGVPLPSDLGLPQGGVGFPTQRSSLGSSSVNQTNVLQVQGGITIQTRADTSALIEQAVMDVFNNAVRRGVFHPELSTMLRGGSGRVGG